MPRRIEFKKGIPIYVQIAEQLRNEISDGSLPVGKPFPSEEEMKRTFGVARGTVRQARSVLKDEGLIQMQRGGPPIVIRQPGDRDEPG
jgi:DNA-binding GntR family transcriptional regulator